MSTKALVSKTKIKVIAACAAMFAIATCDENGELQFPTFGQAAQDETASPAGQSVQLVEPERVIIRNQSNGTFVIGPLIRRERDNPGPALQMYADAASALQMLAGSPTQLQVTALRREEVAETPEAQPTADFEAP